MLAIEAKNIAKLYGINKILEDISFQINEKEKTAFVGQNGCGKTTLFKILTKAEEYNEGTLTVKKGLSMGYLDQIPNYGDNISVIDVLHKAFDEVYDMSERIKELERAMSSSSGKELEEVMKQYADIHHMFEIKGGYSIDENISRVRNGLGFTDEFVCKQFNSLSGGEKTKVILGKILLESPDILLLDEPTNHLDIEAVEWLEGFIKEYVGTVLIISHDRYFLDKVVNKVIEIEDGKATVYNGNYTWYIEEKDRRLTDLLANYNSQQKEIKHMEEAIQRFRDWGHRSGSDERVFKKLRNMEKRLDKMDKIDKPKLEHQKMKMNFSETIRTGNDVLEVRDFSKAFGNKILFKEVYFKLHHLDSVAIIGSNGCGKSTIIKSILNEYLDKLEPKKRSTFPYIKDLEMYRKDEGVIKLGTNIKIAYLDQNIHFSNEEHTVIEEFREDLYVSEAEARNILAKFLFRKDDVFKKVSSLSGGEKTRLRLCQLMQHDINFLILDEPTNHLDIDSKEVLEQALLDFEGTMLFISHDRYFINKIATKIFEVNNKRIKCYDGNYDDYKAEKEKNGSKLMDPVLKKQEKVTQDKKSYEEAIEERSKAKRKQTLENKIHELENQIAAKEKEAHEFGNDYEKVKIIIEEKEKLQSELDRLLEEWIEL